MKRYTAASLVSAFAAMAILGGSPHAEEMKLPMIHGEIKKVDEGTGKITIKHEAITNLGMDPMTMVFKANDPAMLKDVKPGDKVTFTADKVNGQITVMSVEKSK